MLMKVSELMPGTEFETPLTRRDGFVRDSHGCAGILVELRNPQEVKEVHGDTLVLVMVQ